MPGTSRAAMLFISFTLLCGLSAIGYGLLQAGPLHLLQLLTLLVMAALASRLKLKLPGLSGNMSVNLPFILIATIQLSLFEALMVAMASITAQCFPKGGGKPKAVQMVFNVSTAAVAVGIGHWILRQAFLGRVPWTSASLLLALAAASFFLAQTLPVAAMISLSDGGNMVPIWKSICHLSLPYYLLSAGVTSIVTGASNRVGWQIPLLVLALMYGVYRSYQLYFGWPEAAARPSTLAKVATRSG